MPVQACFKSKMAATSQGSMAPVWPYSSFARTTVIFSTSQGFRANTYQFAPWASRNVFETIEIKMAAVSAKRYNILERLVRLDLTGFRFKKLNFKSWLKNISFIRSPKKVWKHIFTFLKNLNFRCNSQLTFHRNLAWLYWSISIRDLFFYSEEIVFDVAYFFVCLCLFVFWRCNWEKFFWENISDVSLMVCEEKNSTSWEFSP